MRLFLLSLPLGVLSLTCPFGYTDGGDGSCYHISPAPASRNTAYDVCAQHSGYLFDVANAFQNNGIQTMAGGASRIWLGLTCTQSTQTSCQWDHGLNLVASSYTNFYAGHPNPDAGPCVYMEVASGFWLNADCAQVNMTFGCKYTPNVQAPLCSNSRISDMATFRGQCYFPVNSYNFYDAVNICNSYCGTVTSIHSPGENQFVYSLGASYSSYDSYMFTGLQYGSIYSSKDIGSPIAGHTTPAVTLPYHWNDSSTVDYTNFGYENPQDGQCVAMALKQDLLKIGQWINTNCNGRLTAVCKKDQITACDLPTTVPATLAPTECTSPYFYSGSGTIYSPGYPYSGNQNNSCEYLISENSGQTASIHFQELNLNFYSNITFYSEITDTAPFKIITYENQWSTKDVYSPTNIIRMYYYATAENPGTWVADYGSGVFSPTPVAWTTRGYGQTTTNTTWYPRNTTTSSGSCGGNYYYSGTIESPNYPSSYPQVTRNCTYFLSAEQSVTCITFDTFDIRYYDYVTLYDGQDTTDIYSIEMARFTGNDGQSGTYCTSFYRTMTVVFETYSYNFGYVQGFKARFAATAAQLNGSSTATTTGFPYTWKPK